VTDDQVKAALAALADGRADADGSMASTTAEHTETGPDDYRATIRRAVEASHDLESAAVFVESVGLDELERAVDLHHLRPSVPLQTDFTFTTVATPL